MTFCDRRLNEGFRMPALCRRTGPDGAGVRKPRKEERGEEEARFGWASYGDLKVADGSRVRLRGSEAAFLSMERRRRACFDREHTRAWREPGAWRGSADGCEDNGGPLRRVAGSETERRCVAGSAATVMRCRS